VIRSRVVPLGVVLVLAAAPGCSDDGGSTGGAGAGSAAVAPGVIEADDDLQRLAADVRSAVEAVDSELGGPQSYFEVTATPRLTNVFVAVADETAAVPYVVIDGVVEPPAPTLEGVAGHTFTAAALTFDESVLLGRIADELPDAIIESVSVEGGPDGAVRYVVSVRSSDGGLLDVVVGPDGAILSAEPV
jgi:hypothetical protein